MKPKPINDYLAHLLAQANRQVNRQLSSEGVALENWRILLTIAEESGPTMRALARKLSMHHPHRDQDHRQDGVGGTRISGARPR
jgi:hypothetical protein